MILLFIGMVSVLLSDVDAAIPASQEHPKGSGEGGGGEGGRGGLCSPHALPALLTYCRTCKEREMQRKKDKTWIRGEKRGMRGITGSGSEDKRIRATPVFKNK